MNSNFVYVGNSARLRIVQGTLRVKILTILLFRCCKDFHVVNSYLVHVSGELSDT
jgi:hypothetical protein